MNVKQITRALHTLSLLSDEDYDLVLKLRALTEDERGLLMTVLQPEKPAGKKASKKASKSSQSSSKSPRATGIEQQLNKRREQGRELSAIPDFNEDGLCGQCGRPAEDNFHHLKALANYHPFAEPVRDATTRSPANGGASSITQNSGASAASAHAATGGSSE